MKLTRENRHLIKAIKYARTRWPMKMKEHLYNPEEMKNLRRKATEDYYAALITPNEELEGWKVAYNLTSEQLRFEQQQIKEAGEVLNRLKAPSNGPEGETLGLASRIEAYATSGPYIKESVVKKILNKIFKRGSEVR